MGFGRATEFYRCVCWWLLWLLLLFLVVVCCRLLLWFVVRVGGVVVGLENPPLVPRSAGQPKNFALSFPSPASIFALIVSLCVFSLNWHTTARELQTCPLEGPDVSKTKKPRLTSSDQRPTTSIPRTTTRARARRLTSSGIASPCDTSLLSKPPSTSAGPLIAVPSP